MGAVRMSVGDIAVDFQEEHAVLIDKDTDVLEHNELDDFKNIDRWAHS